MTLIQGSGSRLLPAQLSRASVELRIAKQGLISELSTNRTSDPARRVRGDIGILGAIEGRLQRIAAQDHAFELQTQTLAAMSSALGRLDSLHAGLFSLDLLPAPGSTDPNVLARIGGFGRTTLDELVSTLQTGHAGKSIFSGDRSDIPPLASTEVILSRAKDAAVGATNVDEVMERIAELFRAPGGGFETELYLGGTPVRLGTGPVANQGWSFPTAADPAIRGVLEATVLVALTEVQGHPLSDEVRRDLVQAAALRRSEVSDQLTNLRAELGRAEADTADRRLRLLSERDALESARDGWLGVDPYDVASRLEETRTRLEAVLLVTARVTRLSLTDFLR